MIRSRVTLATIEAAAIAALFVSPSTTALCGGAERAEPEAVDEARLGARREVGEDVAQPREVRAVEAVAVDVAGGDDAHRDLRRRRRAPPGAAPRAARGSTCFESFSSASGRVRWPLERLVVEQDAGDDERARQRASPRLVRARDEADAEPAVVAEQALSRCECSSPEDIARPGTCSCRLRAGLVPSVARVGSERQDAAGVLLVEHDLPAGVLQRRLVPVAAAVAALRRADEHRRLALDEPGGRVVGAARLGRRRSVAPDSDS